MLNSLDTSAYLCTNILFLQVFIPEDPEKDGWEDEFCNFLKGVMHSTEYKPFVTSTVTIYM